MTHAEYRMLVGNAPFIYRAPHANRPTPPRAHKGRKWWATFGIHHPSRSRARVERRAFA